MPPIPNYLDFDLAIQQDGEQYRARVLHSPGGEGTVNFTLPFSDQGLENLLLKMGQARSRTRGDSKQLGAAKELGGKLFRAVFAGDVLRCWQTSLAKADEQNTNLRIRLRLNDAPELGDLPWELLYDEPLDLFYNRFTTTPLVRTLDLPLPQRPVIVQPPLKILVLISLPKDEPELDADEEWDNLKTALKDLEERGILSLERTDDASLPALQKQLRRAEYHVLHFIGHGEFDERKQESVLVMEDANERARAVTGPVIGTLLHDHRSIRFVFLNACEASRAGRTDPFSGIAQSLIRQGIPAVLAMQFPITDDAALVVSRETYSALADNLPLEAAVAEARKAVYMSGNETEWATPVLYLRAADGVLFDVKPPTAEISTSTSRTPPPRQAPAPAASGPHRDFDAVGKWDIQVQDMVGSRLLVEFQANGTFVMQQQVGMYQVPVNGTWSFNPRTRQLSLQGVVNTFQPFVLMLTLGTPLPNGFTATGSDGIGYVLTRSA